MTWGSEAMRWGSRAAAVDATPPTIGDFDPPRDGTPISATATISFSITDDTGTFHALVIAVAYEGAGLYEVVHDGVEFAPEYRFSTREAITNGYRYSIVRGSSWAVRTSTGSIDFPRFRVIGVDGGGNLVTLE